MKKKKKRTKMVQINIEFYFQIYFLYHNFHKIDKKYEILSKHNKQNI